MRIAIVGSGLKGLFTAYFLLKKGVNVDIYEALPKPGYGSSTKHPGIIHPILIGGDYVLNRLMQSSYEIYIRLSDEIGYQIKPLKLLLLLKNPFQNIMSRLLAYRLKMNGLEFERVSGEKLAKRYYDINPVYHGALLIDGYNLLDPYQLLDNLFRHVHNLGAKFIFNFRVKSLKDELSESDYKYIVFTPSSEFPRVSDNFIQNLPKIKIFRSIYLQTSFYHEYIISEYRPLKTFMVDYPSVIPHYRDDRGVVGPFISREYSSDNMDIVDREEIKRLYNQVKDMFNEKIEIIDYQTSPYVQIEDAREGLTRKVGKYIFEYDFDPFTLSIAPAIAWEAVNKYMLSGSSSF